ncbi:MAG TPA: four-carbon acid sugar kinase family protein [Candidatus Dormibacteraeota bacterium]
MIGLVADDLTGACDSAAPFLREGRVLVSIWPAFAPQAAACLALSTETRDATPEEARTRARQAVHLLLTAGATRIFRKVDSRLRGHLREELAGALDAWPGRCLLAPALPAEGRLTVGGRQVVDGEAIDIATLLDGLERVEVRDAASDADLLAIAGEVEADRELMPAGTAGLAAALARGSAAVPGWPACARPQALVGSKTEVSAAQVDVALEAGWEVRRRARGDAVALEGFDALFLSGGGTAAGVLAELGATALELLGEALPRVPVGRLLDGPHAGLVVALKSGGFGGVDAIAGALARLRSGG